MTPVPSGVTPLSKNVTLPVGCIPSFAVIVATKWTSDRATEGSGLGLVTTIVIVCSTLTVSGAELLAESFASPP